MAPELLASKPPDPGPGIVTEHPIYLSSSGDSKRTIYESDALPEVMRRPLWKLSDFEVHRQLYRSSTSLVVQATDRRTNMETVLKLYLKSKLVALTKYQVEREIRIHSGLSHPNLVQLLAAFENARHVVLVLEWASGGDLYTALDRAGGSLPEDRAVRTVLAPFLQGVAYLHSKNIIHRDIKPENILLSHHSVVKLADFGLSIDCSQERPVTRGGTLDYMAPEVLLCHNKARPEDMKDKLHLVYGSQVDVWAIGVLAYELVVGRPPFQNEVRCQTVESILYQRLSLPSTLSDHARDFITRTLSKSAKKRPTLPELLQHPWILAHAPFPPKARPPCSLPAPPAYRSERHSCPEADFIAAAASAYNSAPSAVSCARGNSTLALLQGMAGGKSNMLASSISYCGPTPVDGGARRTSSPQATTVHEAEPECGAEQRFPAGPQGAVPTSGLASAGGAVGALHCITECPPPASNPLSKSAFAGTSLLPPFGPSTTKAAAAVSTEAEAVVTDDTGGGVTRSAGFSQQQQRQQRSQPACVLPRSRSSASTAAMAGSNARRSSALLLARRGSALLLARRGKAGAPRALPEASQRATRRAQAGGSVPAPLRLHASSLLIAFAGGSAGAGASADAALAAARRAPARFFSQPQPNCPIGPTPPPAVGASAASPSLLHLQVPAWAINSSASIGSAVWNPCPVARTSSLPRDLPASVIAAATAPEPGPGHNHGPLHLNLNSTAWLNTQPIPLSPSPAGAHAQAHWLHQLGSPVAPWAAADALSFEGTASMHSGLLRLLEDLQSSSELAAPGLRQQQQQQLRQVVSGLEASLPSGRSSALDMLSLVSEAATASSQAATAYAGMQRGPLVADGSAAAAAGSAAALTAMASARAIPVVAAATTAAAGSHLISPAPQPLPPVVAGGRSWPLLRLFGRQLLGCFHGGE